MVKCWEVQKCSELNCPVFGSEDLQCWLIADTCCRVESPDLSAGKMEKCLECNVFKTNFDLSLMRVTIEETACQFRKNAENLRPQQLMDEKIKLQTVMDAMDYGLTIQNRDFNIVFQNKTMKEMFGRLGEKCFKIYEGRNCICEECPVEQSFRDGLSHMTEKKVEMPGELTEYWESMTIPIKNMAGEIVSCLEIFRNITEKKNSEEAFRVAKQHLLASELQLKIANQKIQDKEHAIKCSMEEVALIKKNMADKELELRALKKEVNVLIEKAGLAKKYEL